MAKAFPGHPCPSSFLVPTRRNPARPRLGSYRVVLPGWQYRPLQVHGTAALSHVLHAVRQGRQAGKARLPSTHMALASAHVCAAVLPVALCTSVCQFVRFGPLGAVQPAVATLGTVAAASSLPARPDTCTFLFLEADAGGPRHKWLQHCTCTAPACGVGAPAFSFYNGMRARASSGQRTTNATNGYRERLKHNKRRPADSTGGQLVLSS